MTITINIAVYGIVNGKDIEGWNVTSKIRIGHPFTNKEAGGDPYPGKPKMLYVEATVNDQPVSKWFFERDTVAF